jgi:predicted Zn-dependent protease
MRALCAVLVLSACLAAGCKKTSVYFVPVGNAPITQINDLVMHYQQKFDLKSEVLPGIVTSASIFDFNRQQLVAEDVIEGLKGHYSKYLRNDSTILIGVTNEDMYPRGQDWEFCFGWREAKSRIAVVSTARMNLHYIGEPIGATDSLTRMRKVITKDIGLMYYRKSPSHNPHSVLFDGILGIQELDQVSEEF